MARRGFMFPFTLAVVVGCQFEASCGGKNLNVDKAKTFISTTLERETGAKPAKVTCPEPVKIAKGTTFECTADFGGPQAAVVVRQEDDKGFVKIASVTGVLISRKLEAQIAESIGSKLNAHVTVECGPRIRASTPGDEFTCTAKDAAGASGTVAVVVKDSSGNVSFKMRGPTPK